MSQPVSVRVPSLEVKAVALCQEIDNMLNNYHNNVGRVDYLKITIAPETKTIEFTFDEFKIMKEEDYKNISSSMEMTNITNTARDTLTEEEAIKHHIHIAIEVAVENWLKFGIKELYAAYKQRKFYIQIPQGFNDVKKYWDSLDGWSQDALMWVSNYNIVDEVHRVGGLNTKSSNGENK